MQSSVRKRLKKSLINKHLPTEVKFIIFSKNTCLEISQKLNAAIKKILRYYKLAEKEAHTEL